jgi:predicted AAA+ superfamily ATPase
MYSRILDLTPLLKHRSVFLFGPRQAGKSTYLSKLYPNARYINLLKADEFLDLSQKPERLRQSLGSKDELVIIDEIQKLPQLLDEVQAMMLENPKLKFILTGSSARKIKRGQANLLAGRAIVQNFYPLVSAEVGYEQVLKRLNRGSLPAVFDSEIYRDDLRSYVGTYLKEEILEEGLNRGIEGFSRFLEVASLSNGKQINFTEIGNDAGVPPRIIREYYQILEDTLIGFQLPAFQKTIKRKPVSTSKFYFFDIGVTNVLCRRSNIEERSELYGEALEQLIALELKAYLDYQRSEQALTYWRSLSQIEVDFVVGEKLAIEVKAKNRISKRDYKNLLLLEEELKDIRKIIVCNESRYLKTDENVEIMPVEYFLRELWEHRIINFQ